MARTMKVTIIMPTYNEGGHIQDLIKEATYSLVNAGIEEYQILIVDDDSPDQTWRKAAETSDVDLKRVMVLRRTENHGLRASIWDGIQSSDSEIIVWMDCDFSHPPEKIPQMLYMIGQGFDVVVNSRYTIGGGEDREGKGGPLQLFLSRLLNWGVRFMLTPSFSDYTSGFIAVRRQVVEEFPLRGDYGEYFIDFIYRVIRSKKFHICELPYFAQPRRSGESKTGSNFFQYARRGWKYLLTVLRLKFLE